MKKVFTALLMIFFNILLLAQEGVQKRYCDSDLVNQKLMEKDPGFAKRVQDFDNKLSSLIKEGKMKQFYKASENIYEIPVVVHVIHDGSAIGSDYNKSDADIRSWVDYTNQVFAGTAPDIEGPAQGGAMIPVKLVLAKRDMNCQPTTGIVRVDGSVLPQYAEYGVYRSVNGETEEDVKALSRWDARFYYNIYVVHKFDGNDGASGGLMGYAYLAGAPSNYDGSFMVSTVVSNTNFARTTFPHEMMHALGVRHPFNGASGQGGECPVSTGDCAKDDDGICDTESTQSLLNTSPCPTNADINSCTGTYYQGIQYNIMNYGYCAERKFTQGQADKAVVSMLEFRQSLLKSLGKLEPQENPLDISSMPNTCVPSSIGNLDNGYNIGLADLKFGDIDYNSKGYSGDGYEFYIDNRKSMCSAKVFTELTAGSTVPLTASVQTNPQRVHVYIDYNNDGVFNESNELVFLEILEKDVPFTENIVIPTDVVKDKALRMRVIADWHTVPITSCYNPTYGQVEDFVVVVTSNMGTDEVSIETEGVKVYTHNESVFVRSSNTKIQKIEAYNITGQKLFTNEKVLETQYEIPFNKLSKSNIVVLKIQMVDGKNVTQKVILK